MKQTSLKKVILGISIYALVVSLLLVYMIYPKQTFTTTGMLLTTKDNKVILVTALVDRTPTSSIMEEYLMNYVKQAPLKLLEDSAETGFDGDIKGPVPFKYAFVWLSNEHFKVIDAQVKTPKER